MRWLKEEWEPEELQHGRALRSYVQPVWPDFDWERAYAAFFAECSRHCSMDGLQPTRALEVVAMSPVQQRLLWLVPSLLNTIASGSPRRSREERPGATLGGL
ncbi:hypothetical protein WME99_14880 [Sorangium sp. So ce136]|uniref:hypothetical protein n=1 Tax=Sorangium sp. So ce136 TaxID=3133284 RepID=UPI003F028529